MMQTVHSDDAPQPNGHYSQAVVHNDILYMSMQLPIDPETGQLPAGIAEQADQLFRNCENILVAGGSSFQDILTATIYVADMADWPTMNQAFAQHVGDHRPARGMVNVNQLHLGARVGMQLTAACRR